MTNRLLAYFSKKVLMGFSDAFSGEKAILVGNPIRKELLALTDKTISASDSALKVLIIGGSLGARVLNETVPAALMNFKASDVSILHQTGKDNSATVLDAYKESYFEYQAHDFISDMANAYDWADVIICRAGALTVAEVAIVGLPAVFVPLPHAVDDHQTKNAMSLVNANAAMLIAQKDLNPNKLSECLLTLGQNRQLLNTMSQNCKNVAIRDATEQVAAVCNSLV